MQCRIWFNNANYFDVDISVSNVGMPGAESGPEVIAAVVADTKLSNTTLDRACDIVAQALDYINPRMAVVPETAGDLFGDEERDAFRKGELFSEPAPGNGKSK